MYTYLRRLLRATSLTRSIRTLSGDVTRDGVFGRTSPRLVVALLALSWITGACSTPGEIIRPKSLAGLPPEIRAKVASVPYPCLVARDRTMSLTTTIASITEFQQTFMALPVPDQPGGHKFPKGVDSVRENLEFFLVGCLAGADIDALVTKGFADAKVMNISVEIWAPTKTGWTKRAKG
jgi:hypothetical protein